jgi:hypothetical protein
MASQVAVLAPLASPPLAPPATPSPPADSEAGGTPRLQPAASPVRRHRRQQRSRSLDSSSGRGGGGLHPRAAVEAFLSSDSAIADFLAAAEGDERHHRSIFAAAALRLGAGRKRGRANTGGRRLVRRSAAAEEESGREQGAGHDHAASAASEIFDVAGVAVDQAGRGGGVVAAAVRQQPLEDFCCGVGSHQHDDGPDRLCPAAERYRRLYEGTWAAIEDLRRAVAEREEAIEGLSQELAALHAELESRRGGRERSTNGGAGGSDAPTLLR